MKSSQLPAYRAPDPPGILMRAAIVMVLSFAAGIATPMATNWAFGTLHTAEVRSKLRPSVLADVDNFERAHVRRGQALQLVEDRLLKAAEGGDQEGVIELIQLHDHLVRTDKQNPPVAISGYYLDDSMPLWFLFYLGLGWLLALLSPSTNLDSKAHVGRTITKAAAILPFVYVFYRVPTWFRNTALGEVGRKVYAYPNLDISVGSFFVQEGMAFLFCALLSIVWVRWFVFFDDRTRELQEHSKRASESVVIIDGSRIERLQNTFLHWQFSSLTLAVAFLYSTFFFWSRVARDGDIRFAWAAVVTHLLWIATWMVLTAPLFITWRDWIGHCDRVRVSRANTRGDKSGEYVLATLDKLRPVSFWNVTSSTVLAVASLLLPIVQGFR